MQWGNYDRCIAGGDLGFGQQLGDHLLTTLKSAKPAFRNHPIKWASLILARNGAIVGAAGQKLQISIFYQPIVRSALRPPSPPSSIEIAKIFMETGILPMSMSKRREADTRPVGLSVPNLLYPLPETSTVGSCISLHAIHLLAWDSLKANDATDGSGK